MQKKTIFSHKASIFLSSSDIIIHSAAHLWQSGWVSCCREGQAWFMNQMKGKGGTAPCKCHVSCICLFMHVSPSVWLPHTVLGLWADLHTPVLFEAYWRSDVNMQRFHKRNGVSFEECTATCVLRISSAARWYWLFRPLQMSRWLYLESQFTFSSWLASCHELPFHFSSHLNDHVFIFMQCTCTVRICNNLNFF